MNMFTIIASAPPWIGRRAIFPAMAVLKNALAGVARILPLVRETFGRFLFRGTWPLTALVGTGTIFVPDPTPQ